MKIITSKFFAENPNTLVHLPVNRERQRAVLDYLHSSHFPYMEVDLRSITEQECLTILADIHMKEYIDKARMSEMYSSSLEYLKLIKHGAALLPKAPLKLACGSLARSYTSRLPIRVSRSIRSTRLRRTSQAAS